MPAAARRCGAILTSQMSVSACVRDVRGVRSVRCQDCAGQHSNEAATGQHCHMVTPAVVTWSPVTRIVKHASAILLVIYPDAIGH